MDVANTIQEIKNYGDVFYSVKPVVIITVLIGNRKQIRANSERNLSPLLELICSLYA